MRLIENTGNSNKSCEKKKEKLSMSLKSKLRTLIDVLKCQDKNDLLTYVRNDHSIA